MINKIKKIKPSAILHFNATCAIDASNIQSEVYIIKTFIKAKTPDLMIQVFLL
jgi:hypothetical protein